MFRFFKRKKRKVKGGDEKMTLKEKLEQLAAEGLLTEEEAKLINEKLDGVESSTEETTKDEPDSNNINQDNLKEPEKTEDPHPQIDEKEEEKTSVEEIKEEAKQETLEEEKDETPQEQAQEENVLLEEINKLKKEIEDLKAQLEASKSVPKKPQIVNSECGDYGYGTKVIY